MALTESRFDCLCPNCEEAYSLPVGAFGRSTCLKCGKRFLVTDIDSEVREFQQTHRVCQVVNSAKKYQYSAYKVDQITVGALMGSSRSMGDDVYAHAWLKSIGDEIFVLISGRVIGIPHRSVTSNFISPSLYSTSPFENGPCVMKTSCRMVVTALKPKVKTKVFFCLFEGHDNVPEKEISSADAVNKLSELRGTFCQDFASFENVTIDECVRFFNNDGGYSDITRTQARSNPAGPKYFAGFDEFNLGKQCEWRSNDHRYRVNLKFEHKKLEVTRVFFSDMPASPGVSWFTEPPPKKLRRFEGTRKIPIVWKQSGRTASFELTPDGRHVPAEPFSRDFVHFWSDLIVFELVEEQGSQKLVYGTNRAIKSVFDSLRKGDEVFLKLEPENYYDPNAVSVVTAGGVKIGYLRAALSKLLREVSSQVIVVVDEHHEFAVKLLLCVSSLRSNTDLLREYAKRVFDAYPDPNW